MSMDRVIVGGGHFIERSGRFIQQAELNLPRVANMPERITRIVQSYDPTERGGGLGGYQERQWDRIQEGLKDLAEAWGHGKSGDLQGAYEKGLDAAVKAGEIFKDQLESAFRGFTR